MFHKLILEIKRNVLTRVKHKLFVIEFKVLELFYLARCDTNENQYYSNL